VRDTLEGIYRDHRQGLFTVALSITRDAGRAEDAVHDAFVRLCRAAAGGGKATGDPVAYTFAAVRNAAVDITRKRGEVAIGAYGRSGASIFDGATRGTRGEDAAALRSADAAIEIGEAADAVRAALDELPTLQREVLVMKTYAGLTFEQIAQACGEPLSTVASRYRRSLDQLKERLKSVV